MKRFNKLLSEISEIGHHVAVVLKSNDEEKVKKSLENLGIKSEKNNEQDTISQKPTEIILNEISQNSSNKQNEVDQQLKEDAINIENMGSEKLEVTETLKPNYDEQLAIKQIKSFIEIICKNEFVKEAARFLDNKSDLFDLVSNGLDFDNEQDTKFFQMFSNYTSSLDQPIEHSGNINDN